MLSLDRHRDEAVVPWWQVELRSGHTREGAIDFVRPESEFYPGLGPWYVTHAHGRGWEEEEDAG